MTRLYSTSRPDYERLSQLTLFLSIYILHKAYTHSRQFLNVSAPLTRTQLRLHFLLDAPTARTSTPTVIKASTKYARFSKKHGLCHTMWDVADKYSMALSFCRLPELFELGPVSKCFFSTLSFYSTDFSFWFFYIFLISFLQL